MKSFQNITKNAELHTFEMNVSVFMKYTISVFHDHNYLKHWRWVHLIKDTNDSMSL